MKTYKRAHKIRERNKHATKGKIDHLKEAMTAKMVTMVMYQNRFEKMTGGNADKLLHPLRKDLSAFLIVWTVIGSDL